MPRGVELAGHAVHGVECNPFSGPKFLLFASVACLFAGGHGTGSSLQGKIVWHGTCKT